MLLVTKAYHAPHHQAHCAHGLLTIVDIKVIVIQTRNNGLDDFQGKQDSSCRDVWPSFLYAFESVFSDSLMNES